MPVLLTEQAGRVLELLTMYIQSPGELQRCFVYPLLH